MTHTVWIVCLAKRWGLVTSFLLETWMVRLVFCGRLFWEERMMNVKREMCRQTEDSWLWRIGKQAIEVIEATTNMKMPLRTNQNTYIRFVELSSSGACGSANVGKLSIQSAIFQYGSPYQGQPVSVKSISCKSVLLPAERIKTHRFVKMITWHPFPFFLGVENATACGVGTAIHEIMHAAGVIHEHSRDDRDNFVTINTECIKSGAQGNFNKVGSVERTIYDFNSVRNTQLWYAEYFFAAASWLWQQEVW